ncbi:MAG: response regulator [Leptolyngbyaceae cyanobacterium MAG.088]|nr:response regulator [Leptolyngbyaceae cyanobacterium MAG.088]
MLPKRPQALNQQINRRVLLLSLIAFLGLGGTLVEGVRRQINQVHHHLENLNYSAVETLDLFILDLESSLLNTGETLHTSQNQQLNLRYFISRYHSLQELIYLNNQGEIIHQAQAFGQPSRSANYVIPWLSKPPEVRHISISDPQYSGTQPYIEVVVPVLDDIGLPMGILVARLNLTELWDTTLDIEVGRTGYSYLATETGQLIGYHGSAISTNTLSLNQRIGKTPQSIHQTELSIYRGLRDQWVLASAQPLRQVDWYIIIEQPLQEALGQLVLPLVILLLVTLTILLLVWNTFKFTQQRLVTPLKQLEIAIKETRQGQPIPPLALPYDDELAQLAALLTEISHDNATLYSSLEDQVNQRTLELQRSQEKFSKAFYSNTDPMAITTFPEGYYVEVNDAMVDVCDKERSKILDKEATEIFKIKSLNQQLSFSQVLQEQRAIRDWEVEYATDSQPKQVYLLSAELMLLNQRQCALICGKNITARKQVEERLAQAKEDAELANRTKSQFLAHMSHELRTPLNAILGFSQLLGRDQELTEEQRNTIVIINRSGEHLLTLINNILEMSKIEAGKSSLHTTDFDLHYLLHSLKEMLGPKAHKKGIQFLLEYSQTLPQYICTDDGKLRQVLINLINNGIKFTQKGHVILKIGYEVPHNHISFSVTDTGPGIEKQDISTLFEPFTQTQLGKQSSQGTGLGLPISQTFVSLMGGKLTIESYPGQGSTFAFSIPVERPKSTLVNSQRTYRERHVIGLAPGQIIPKVLVVEDHLDTQQLMIRLLSSIGLNARAVNNGQAAVDLCQHWSPHLVFMDICLPGMDGITATRLIKTQSSKPVVIALTAQTFENEKHLALSAGCDDFVRKPFLEHELWHKIAQHLDLTYMYSDTTIQPKISIPKTIPNHQDQIQQQLQEMSNTWKQELNTAVKCLNSTMILELIEQVPADKSALAEAIKLFTYDFRYDFILKMLNLKA